jgi:adenine-specific DNA-methyltransferase
MSINYIGSKKTLLNFLLENFKKNISFESKIRFGDGFAGTGCVGQYISSVYNHINIHAVDIEKYSFIINYSKLCVSYTPVIQQIIDKINDKELLIGLITKYYSPHGNRNYFTIENAKRIDTARIYIEELKLSISEDEYIFLLGSLLTSADKCANISCVYGAYLKNFKNSALKKFKLIPIHTKVIENTNHNIEMNNILNVDWSDTDIVYFDPPYNNRQYGSNYFILNFILDYDETLVSNTVTGITTYFKSTFCKKKLVEESFRELLNNPTLPQHIFISYNNEGLLQINEFRKLLSNYGNVTLYEIEYKKFKAQQNIKNDKVIEYLWYIDNKNIK